MGSFVRNYIDPKQYVVQLTEEANATSIEQYISNGYEVVFSNYDVWNFEGPAASWVSENKKFRHARDTPRPSWRDVYENSPFDMLTDLGSSTPRDSLNRQVHGGEAMLWSYETDAASLQPTAWPRGAALAERLWTNPQRLTFTAEQAESRMAIHRERMVERGTRAETFQPEYCFQNQDSCYSQKYRTYRDALPQGLNSDLNMI